MKFSNAYYSKKLTGHQAPLGLLQGRDFRPDRHHLFSAAEEEENIWYKTFSVGLDQSCQEAYFILGLLLDEENIIKEAGAGVMYMDSGTGNCMFSFASDEDSEADVDDIEADSLEEDPDEPEEEDAPKADDEEEDSWEETPRAKRIMDILPLDEMLTGRKPYFLEHETAMIIKGRWLTLPCPGIWQAGSLPALRSRRTTPTPSSMKSVLNSSMIRLMTVLTAILTSSQTEAHGILSAISMATAKAANGVSTISVWTAMPPPAADSAICSTGLQH